MQEFKSYDEIVLLEPKYRVKIEYVMPLHRSLIYFAPFSRLIALNSWASVASIVLSNSV